MKILFKFTTKSRPNLFIRGMQSIIENVSSENYEILVTVDTDDYSMEHALLYYQDNVKVKVYYGISKNKIDAINRDVDKANNWDILVNVSDDMVFTIKGFDKIIRSNFDNLGQCLHFPDGNTTELITMSIIGKQFYDRFGYIYNPQYESLFCDNEQTDVAKFLGAYKYVDKQIFEHKHPAFGKAQMDAQYYFTESFFQKDKVVYESRKAINFGL
jgi:hypothetical protein